MLASDPGIIAIMNKVVYYIIYKLILAKNRIQYTNQFHFVFYSIVGE